MNFAGKYSPQNTPDQTASQITDALVASGNAKGQKWRLKDKAWQGYETSERMNIVYDKVGHGDQVMDMIVGENERKRKDRQLQEKLNIIAHEKALMKENPSYETPFNQNLEEQETLSADNDPLFRKVSKSLKRSVDYPKKPSKKGYPNDPPPKMVNGYHPDLVDGIKVSNYYNTLDPNSAKAMPKTGNDFIDMKVDAAKKGKYAKKSNQLKEEISVKTEKKTNWREEINLQESEWFSIPGSGPTNSASQSFQYGGEGGPTATFSGIGGAEGVPSTVTSQGETYDSPTYNQLAMQGYAPLLQMQKRGNQTEDERIDAEIRKLEEQIKDSKAKETAAIEAWNAELIATMDRHGREWEAVLKKDGGYNPEKHKGLQARQGAEMDAIWSKEPKTEPYETERQNLRAKIAELEKQRPINQQLDASQQVYPNLPFMGARVQPVTGQPSFNYDPSKTPSGADYGEVSQVIDGEKLLPQELQDILNRRRGKSPALGGNPTQAEKKRILNYASSPEGVDLMMKDPDTFDRLMNVYMGVPSEPSPEFRSPVQQPGDSLDGFLRGGGMIDPLAGVNAFRSGIRSLGDPLADKLNVGTAKDVFDYFTDWNKNKTKDSRPQDLTNLLTPNDKAALQDLVDRTMDGRTDEFGAMGVNNELQTIINRNPGLRNSIGTLDHDAGDGAYVQGDNIVINKAYDFSNVFDILGAGSPPVGFGALGYGIGSGTFSIPELIFGTDTMNIQIKIPIRRKKKKRKVKESTWSKLKKHR